MLSEASETVTIVCSDASVQFDVVVSKDAPRPPPPVPPWERKKGR